MFENFKIKRKIRKLKNVPVGGQFLLSLRNKLIAQMNSNPVIKKEGERSNFIILTDKLKLMPIPLIIALIVALGGGGAAVASQNSLPGDTLYSVKILTEDIREAVTFNTKAKANLEIKFANERLAEIKKTFEKNGAEPKGLDVALSRFEKHITKANSIMEKKEQRGEETEDLKEKINEIKLQKDSELRMEAEKAINEAKELRQGIVGEPDSFKQYDNFIVKAQEAFNLGHYVQARQHAKQAKDALGRVQRNIERVKEEIKNSGNNKNSTTTSEKQKENENKGNNDQEE